MDLTLVGAVLGAIAAFIGVIAGIVQILDYVERKRRAPIPTAPSPKYEPLTPLESLPSLPEDQEVARWHSARAEARARGNGRQSPPAPPESLQATVEDVTLSPNDPVFEEIEEYEKALELGFENTDIWWGLGAAYEEAGEVEKAVEAYSHALELEPRYGAALYSRALLYSRLGDLDKAISDMRELSVMPSYQRVARYWLAVFHSKKRRVSMNQLISTLLSQSSKS